MNFLARTIFLGSFLLCLTFMGHKSFAQETFNLKSSSTKYDLEVRIDRCDEDRRKDDASTCSGPGRVSIYDKGATAPFQILMFKNLEVNKEQLAYNSDVDKSARKLYDDEYSFIFGDFNFDGTEDLAICNGREGGYGAPSYNVYLYNVTSQKFVENIKLSRSASRWRAW